MSISLHPGTNLARHANLFLHRVGGIFKFCRVLRYLLWRRFFYLFRCGRGKRPDRLKAHARDRTDDAVTHLETGELPDMNGIDIGDSHGEITSLYAGATPDAGDVDFNGEVQ